MFEDAEINGRTLSSVSFRINLYSKVVLSGRETVTDQVGYEEAESAIWSEVHIG